MPTQDQFTSRKNAWSPSAKAEDHVPRTSVDGRNRRPPRENDFRHSQSPYSTIHRSLHLELDNLMPPAPPSGFDDRRVSSNSLHPTRDSLSEADIPDSQLEASWRNADLSASSRSRRQDENNDIPIAINSISFTVGEQADGAVAAYSPSTPQLPPNTAASLQRSRTQEDEDLMALKMAAYGGSHAVGYNGFSSYNGITPPAGEASAQAVATVLDFDAHPAEHGAVRAELVGEDLTTKTAMASTSALQGSVSSFGHGRAGDEFPMAASSNADSFLHSGLSQVEATAAVSDEDSPTEVHVIDSEPIVEEDVNGDAWASAVTEEAHVLADDVGEVVDLDRKPPAVDHSGYQPSATEATLSFDEEAEVLDIADEVHPSELGYSNDSHAQLIGSQAELIGTDDHYAVAFPSTDVIEAPSRIDEVNLNRNEAGIVNVEADYPHAEGEMVVSAYHEESFDQPDEAEVVQITEEYHPAENEDADAEAEYVAEATSFTPSTTAEAIVDGDAAHATLVGDSQSSHISVLASPSSNQAPTPVMTTIVEPEEDEVDNVYTFRKGDPQPPVITPAVLSTTSPNQTSNNPFDDDPCDSPAMSRDGLAALENINRGSDWMRRPSDVSGTVPVPPPSAESVTTPPLPSRSHIQEAESATSRNSNRSDEGGSRSGGLHMLSSGIARGTTNLMETLFGDTPPLSGRRKASTVVGFDTNSIAGSILPRTLLPSSVIHSQASHSWVATVNTNQKALDSNNVEESSKSLRAFSVPTKQQAICLARAWAPPRMHPFESNPACFICESKFAVFRRACHCRNCGVCVCSQCSLQWPSKMLPDTYNIKKESSVNICKACDWLCSSFRLALLEGDFDKAVALYATGNLNLTTPFANVKGELFYPVHCAVIGGNLHLLKWLVDEHCCPLRSIRISNGRRKDPGSYTPILTSKGRSLLGIALNNRHIGMVRYLVVQKRMSLAAEQSLSLETVIQNLDLVLRVLPEEVIGQQTIGAAVEGQNAGPLSLPPLTPNQRASSVNQSSSSVAQEAIVETISEVPDSADAFTDTLDDACIICFSNPIDCVVTPCGHQICCLECSENISRCPVCSVECSFMRVFRP